MSLSGEASRRLKQALASESAGAEVATAIDAAAPASGNNTFSGTNTFTGAIVIGAGLTASGAVANDFSGSTGTFKTSSGVNTISGAVTFLDTLTITDAKNIVLGTSTGTQFGTAVGQKWAAHGATPVAQRAGAAQAAVVTTASTQTTPWGFATQAQADAIVALVNELRAALVEKGLIKGAA